MTAYFLGSVVSSTPGSKGSFYNASTGSSITGALTFDPVTWVGPITNVDGTSTLSGAITVALQDETGSVNWSGSGQMDLQPADEWNANDTISAQIGSDANDTLQPFLAMSLVFPSGTLNSSDLGWPFGSQIDADDPGNFGFVTDDGGPAGFEVLDFNVEAVSSAPLSRTSAPEPGTFLGCLLGLGCLAPRIRKKLQVVTNLQSQRRRIQHL